MALKYTLAMLLMATAAMCGDEPPAQNVTPSGLKTEPAPGPDQYVIASGTRIPLGLINSVSTKSAAEGDRVYLETVFPIMARGRIVIPPGSYVAGTVTAVKRPGRTKGRGELHVRFDSLTLPSGATREFRARLGGIDGRGGEEFDKNEGKVVSESNKAGDARTIAETAGAGASIGLIAGAATHHYGEGGLIGAAAGATAGLVGVLLTRGPDAVLAKGSTIEMITDRPLAFDASELSFGPVPPGHFSDGPGPDATKKSSTGWRPWPF